MTWDFLGMISDLYFDNYKDFEKQINDCSNEVVLKVLFDICNEYGFNEAKIILIHRLNKLDAPAQGRLELGDIK